MVEIIVVVLSVIVGVIVGASYYSWWRKRERMSLAEARRDAEARKWIL